MNEMNETEVTADSKPPEAWSIASWEYAPAPRYIGTDRLHALARELFLGCVEVETRGRRFKLLGDEKQAAALLGAGRAMRAIGARIEEFMRG